MIVNAILPVLQSCWGFFALGHGVFCFGVIQHSSLDGRSAAICNFGVLSGEVERMSFYSAILVKMLRMEKAIHVWTQGIYGRYPYLPHNLAVNQPALKIMTLKMKQTIIIHMSLILSKASRAPKVG